MFCADFILRLIIRMLAIFLDVLEVREVLEVRNFYLSLVHLVPFVHFVLLLKRLLKLPYNFFELLDIFVSYFGIFFDFSQKFFV